MGNDLHGLVIGTKTGSGTGTKTGTKLIRKNGSHETGGSLATPPCFPPSKVRPRSAGENHYQEVGNVLLQC